MDVYRLRKLVLCFSMRHLGKLLFLLLWWSIGLAVAVFWGINNHLKVQTSGYAKSFANFTLRKDHMQAFGYTRWDSTRNYRPLYSVYFDELSTTNGQFGIFKTGVYKIAKVKGLQLKLFRYSLGNKTVLGNFGSARNHTVRDNYKGVGSIGPQSKRLFDKSGTTNRGYEKGGLFKEMPFEALLGEIMPRIEGYSFTLPVRARRKYAATEIEVTVGGIDLSNVTDVRVNDFDYQLFDNSIMVLRVQSKRAMAFNKPSDVILRGHVTITVADGSKMESNYVKWNLEKGLFEVDGVYVLSRKGMKTCGKNICVDIQLNTVGTRQAKSKQKETEKCFAKL